MTVPAPGLLTRGRALLHSPRAPHALGLLAFVMSLPSLGLGFQLDDRTYLRLFAHGRSPAELLHEAPTQLAQEKALGVFAWWSGPNFTIHFLRPLSSFSHWLEYRLWPDTAWAMHLSNCVLYALLVACAACIYQALLPSLAAAGLAALMFAVDDSHAQSVGWIASRHTILGSLFGLLALLLHVRARKHASGTLRIASVVCTALTLLTAEFGVAALAYIVAYALVFESGTFGARLGTIWPHMLLAAAWFVAYMALGCGVHDAGWYRDPATAPLETLLGGLADMPLWLLSQLGGDVANLALVIPQRVARILALICLVPVLLLLVPVVLRTQAARFCASGMLLSLLPLFGTVPQDRLLLAASFGGFGWIACLLDGLHAETSAFVRSAAQAFKIPHLIVAPLAYVPLLGGLTAIDESAQALANAVPSQGIRQAIVLNLPLELLTNAAWSIRATPDIPLYQLYAGFSELTVQRPDANTLEITAHGGWGSRPLERMFASRRSMPALHSVRTLTNMRVTVLAVADDGLPSRVRFTFPDALDSQDRAWLVWKGTRPVPWRPPAVGAKVSVDAPSMLGLVF
jgi:hypothetical protein